MEVNDSDRCNNPKFITGKALSYTRPNRLISQLVLRQAQDRLFDILDIIETVPPLAINRTGFRA